MAPLVLSLLCLAAPDAGARLKPIRITADRLELFESSAKAIYTGHVKAIRDTTTVTSDRLEVFFTPERDVGRIVAQGNVEAVDGERWASGEHADYDNHLGLLTVTGSPRARQGERRVAGERVQLYTDANTITVDQARTEAVEAANGKAQRVTIDADTLTLEPDKTTAVWKGHVRAKRGPTLLTAPLLTAHYDDAGTITSLVAQGGVEAFEGDRWAKGKKATYDATTGVLVVTGQPEARQGTTRLRGTKVTFVTGQSKIEVENAVTVISVEKGQKKR